MLYIYLLVSVAMIFYCQYRAVPGKEAACMCAGCGDEVKDQRRLDVVSTAMNIWLS
jgi:hypothetical protein